MSFKDHDKRTFVVDACDAFTRRQICERDFMRKMGMAGVGFSAFGSAFLGGSRPFQRPDRPRHRHGAGAGRRHDEMARATSARSISGTKIRYTSEATPPTIVVNQLVKRRVHQGDRHRGRGRDRAARAGARRRRRRTCRASSAPTTSIISTSPGWRRSPRTSVDPQGLLRREQGARHAGLRLGRLLQAPRRRHRDVRGQDVRRALRHPDLHPDVPQGPLRQAQDRRAEDDERVHGGGEGADRGREGQRHLRHDLPGQVRPLLARMRLDRLRLGPWRLDLQQGQEVLRQ